MAGNITFSEQGGAQAGQPGETVEVSQSEGLQITAPQTGQPNTGLTEEQLRQIVGDAVKSQLEGALEGVRRNQQSAARKLENRIRQQVEGQIELLKAAGQQVAPDQARAIENVIRQRAEQEGAQPGQDSQPGQDNTQPAAQPSAGAAQAAPDELTAKAWQMMEIAGVTIEDEDPEAKALVMTKEGFIPSIVAAIAAKQARLTTPPSARVPAGGGTPGPISRQGMTSTEILDRAFKGLRR